MRVKCPKCRRTDTYVTTDKYNPDAIPHGGMITLRNPKHKGGMTFGTVKGTSSIGAAFMECCDCGGQLVVNNRLWVFPDDEPESQGSEDVADIEEAVDIEVIHQMPCGDPLLCPQCGKECKTPSGLVNHIRKAHP